MFFDLQLIDWIIELELNDSIANNIYVSLENNVCAVLVHIVIKIFIIYIGYVTKSHHS